MDEGLAGWLECTSGTFFHPLFWQMNLSLKADTYSQATRKSVRRTSATVRRACCEPKLRRALLSGTHH